MTYHEFYQTFTPRQQSVLNNLARTLLLLCRLIFWCWRATALFVQVMVPLFVMSFFLTPQFGYLNLLLLLPGLAAPLQQLLQKLANWQHKRIVNLVRVKFPQEAQALSNCFFPYLQPSDFKIQAYDSDSPA